MCEIGKLKSKNQKNYEIFKILSSRYGPCHSRYFTHNIEIKEPQVSFGQGKLLA